MFTLCEACNGMRYNRETLEVKYKGKNIHEVLKMPVVEALIFFDAVPVISKKLKTLKDVGLGYITLGQQATTLSGVKHKGSNWQQNYLRFQMFELCMF